ncbi:hypothetical protein KY285_029941 [Solanum tuberosum]|nr:hypothetical protein KY285_029941 [Solanum tuberosum]
MQKDLGERSRLWDAEDFEEVMVNNMHLPSLRTLDLSCSRSLMRTPDAKYGTVVILKRGSSSLEKFPEILGSMKPDLKVKMRNSGIKELPSSIIQHHTVLDLSDMNKLLVALPRNICKLKGLVKLNVSNCSKLKSLPEEIGDLENMVELDATFTLISQPPSSIVRLNKLNILNFYKQKSEVGLNDGVFFVFPQVNEGLHSLEYLDLSYCNLIDGGLPKDIGCLSSLKELYLSGNNFEHLPRSIAQLGALQSLDHHIAASDSLSLRVFTTKGKNIPSWFHHRGTGRSVSVSLPENWYVRDSFLGFAVCYSGSLIDTKAYLIPSCNRMSWMTQKLSASSYSKCVLEPMIHFFLVPLAGLWDTYKANGKTPNDYGIISLFFEEMKEFGFCLLYKDEPGLVALSRYDNSERHDFVTNEASCSSSETLQLFPTATSPGF